MATDDAGELPILRGGQVSTAKALRLLLGAVTLVEPPALGRYALDVLRGPGILEGLKSGVDLSAAAAAIAEAWAVGITRRGSDGKAGDPDKGTEGTDLTDWTRSTVEAFRAEVGPIVERIRTAAGDDDEGRRQVAELFAAADSVLDAWTRALERLVTASDAASR